MNQQDFTNYIVVQLLGKYPQLTPYTVDGHENVAYLELPSPHHQLKLLISTRDLWLTIGFSAGPGLFDWHRHIDVHESIEAGLAEVARVIDDIVVGEGELVYSSVLGYCPGDSKALEKVKRWQQPGEVVELRYWRDL